MTKDLIFDGAVCTSGAGHGADPRDLLLTGHTVDAAAALAAMHEDAAREHLMATPLARRVEIFGYLPPDKQAAMALVLRRAELAEIVSAMHADDRADLYKKLAPEQQEALLPGLAQAEREDIRRLVAYEEGTAGALMTSDYATLSPGLSVRDAIEVLRREAPDKETIYRAYVLDKGRRPVGLVRLRDLILAPGSRKVADVMEREPVSIQTGESQEEVARMVARYDVIALPVVDEGGRLVGIVTHDDALDALQAENTEDFQKIGAAGHVGQSLRAASIGLLYRKRIVWLALLVFGNLFSGAGIAYFEGTISAHVALVFFLPLLIGSSGNAGAQSATLMVRALATGDVVLGDWGRLLARELMIALALGATMALAVSTIGFVRGGPEIALVVASTMLLVVLAGSLIGMSLPFVLDRLRLDPATASAPLVTTIADAVGVVIYFTLAAMILVS